MHEDIIADLLVIDLVIGLIIAFDDLSLRRSALGLEVEGLDVDMGFEIELAATVGFVEGFFGAPVDMEVSETAGGFQAFA